MQLRFDEYLSAVESYLQPLPASIRQGEVDEMAGHLQQLHADFVAAGHADEAAQEMALARFGSARQAGLRLRDVWEGNKGALWCFMAVVLSNYVLFVANIVAGSIGVFILVSESRALAEAMTPVFMSWLGWTIFLLPLSLNFALGRWGGRRTVFCALLMYLPWWGVHFYGLESLTVFNVANILAHFPQLMMLTTLAATLGAWLGSNSKHRQRFVIIGGAAPESASALLQAHQTHQRRRFWLRASTCTLVLTVIGGASFAIKSRVDNVLHPPTPEAAVRVMLSDGGMNSGDMNPATNVSTRLLPTTAEELQKGERRVSYTATMHATEDYRQRRIAYMHKKLRNALADDQNGDAARPYRLSLARLNPEGYTISLIAHVEKTPQGWEVQYSDKATARAWLYDMYYEQ